MKVIFKANNKIKDVNFGYAVNYLIPKGLAVVATKEKITQLKKTDEKKAQENLQKTAEEKELAAKFKGKKITISAKAGKKQIFGSITKKEILSHLGLKGKKAEIILEKPIKKLGLHQVMVKLGSEQFTVNIEVVKRDENR